MAISVTQGSQVKDVTSYRAVETMTQSTATAIQSLSIAKDVHILGGGTATSGFLNQKYLLPTSGAIEGEEHLICMDATGVAWLTLSHHAGRMLPAVSAVMLPAATAVDAVWASATGAFAFTASNQYVLVKYWNGLWEAKEARGATLATATS